MQTASLYKFVKGGGGLVGVKHNCRLDNFRVTEHALEKKDKATGTVLERFPTSTFVAFDITVEDQGVEPEYAKSTQYLRVGRVPAWRTQQLNEVIDATRAQHPGGILPSLDGENPATSGPFAVPDGESGIWEGEEWPMFEVELHNLASAAGVEPQYLAGLDSKGVASLNAIRVFLDQKVKPKGKKAAADPNAKDKTVIVPTKINQWPWDTAPAAPAAQAAPAAAPAAAIQIPAATVAPGPAIVPPTAGSPPVGTPNYDASAIDWIKRAALSVGGIIKVADVTSTAFRLTSAPDAGIDGVTRMQIMQRLNGTPPHGNFIAQAAAAGHFLLDEGAGTLMVVG